MATGQGISVRLLGVPEFNAGLRLIVVRVAANTEIAAKEAGDLIVAHIRAHMDGRPGPNRISSKLFDSISSESVRTAGVAGNAGGWAARIEASADYARRIEFGFNGTDSLGRTFHQPPYPYFEPGMQEAVDDGLVEDTFEAAWAAAIRGV